MPISQKKLAGIQLNHLQGAFYGWNQKDMDSVQLMPLRTMCDSRKYPGGLGGSRATEIPVGWGGGFEA